MTMKSSPEQSSTPMAEKAIDDVSRMMKAEVSSARGEMERKAARLAPATLVLGVAGVTGLLGLQALVFSPALHRPGRAVLTGAVLLSVAGIAGIAAVGLLPPAERERLADEVKAGARAVQEQRG
jgi:hypothetical protein